jgi:5-methyltetrahydropteroyltriglutamate--homocysteine methyltransferase
MFSSVATAALGFPRMGPKRELKFALEKYWKGKINREQLIQIAHTIEEQSWQLQIDAGIGRITVGDYCLYDNVVTWVERLGLVPERFGKMEPGMDRMFAMARGVEGATALSMMKWIDANYHYMVPEVDETTKVDADLSDFLADVTRGVKKLGTDCATPVVLGPVSIIRLVKFHASIDDAEGRTEALLDQLLPIYNELLKDLKSLGVTEVQIHEPALVFAEAHLLPLFKKAYPTIIGTGSCPSINMVTFFEDVGAENYQWLMGLDEISVVSLDFTRGDNLSLVENFGFADTKVLGVGIISARNVWKVDPSFVDDVFGKLSKKAVINIRVQPSASLQFIPWDLSCEEAILSKTVGRVLSFTIQKLAEVALLARVARGNNVNLLQDHKASWSAYRTMLVGDRSVTDRVASLTEKDFSRDEVFEVRRLKQLKGTPLLPTTTIGSFPQTPEVRKLRTQLKKGIITKDNYDAAIDKQIAFAVGIQESLGLDIFVHGEAERTDMVEFFAQNMDGMLFTTNGWVQSFGSRCVRPPIFWNDIKRQKPMTIREFAVAQSLTTKPVKGMLTGPVTILNWSFPRVDVTRETQAMQIALAIRDEIADLEEAGCSVIQVDEPALREAMPLREAKKEEYLRWTVDSFRLATAGAKNETQIHTHMCYCEFDDCMEAIDRMDTDVNSIENARNDNYTLRAFKRIGYNKGLGPGVYDIHSPVVPSVGFVKNKIKSFLYCMEVGHLCINPDCGLKTRTWPETIGALKNMVEANDQVRSELGLPTSSSFFKAASLGYQDETKSNK